MGKVLLMLPESLRSRLRARIAGAEHRRELVVDVMMALQETHGYLTDEGVAETAALLGMTPLEVEELATFYDFVYREPVGRYVIRVCDGVVCWMNGQERLAAHLCRTLGIGPGETTPDGLFTLLPVSCLGYCDRSPAMLVNREVYGHLTAQRADEILEKLRCEAQGGDPEDRGPGTEDRSR
jgi:NADH-quinone oxidoreductase subunit E